MNVIKNIKQFTCGRQIACAIACETINFLILALVCADLHIYMIYIYTYCSEPHSVFEGSSSTRDLHEVPSTLYDETNLTNAHNFQASCTKTPAEHVYDVATSAVVAEGYPYETPVPLHVNDAFGGSDK